MAEAFTKEDAIELGKQTAEENLKANPTLVPKESGTTDPVKEGQDQAARNHEAQLAEADETGIAANDTSKSGKVNTAKSQLDPTGDDPISATEVSKSATNADMTTGNKTAVSNQEAADRSKNPGEAEENAPRSTANGGPDDADDADVPEKVLHANKNEDVNALEDVLGTTPTDSNS